MLVMRASLLLFALLILVGCVGPRVPVKKIDELPLEERRAVLGLPIYNESQLAGKEYTVIIHQINYKLSPTDARYKKLVGGVRSRDLEFR